LSLGCAACFRRCCDCHLRQVQLADAGCDADGVMPLAKYDDNDDDDDFGEIDDDSSGDEENI
jgi:hypothetical protein